MPAIMAILDGYTVEPSGLGVPPYLSTYVRDAYSALRKANPSADVRYLTIDDVRWCLNGGAPCIAPPQSDPRTYSATVNRDRAIQILADAEVLVVVAGDKVPSVHLHAENASADELFRAIACVRGYRVLLGPLATYALSESAAYSGLFDAIHFQTYGPSEHGPELLFPDTLVQAVVTEIVRADRLAAPVEAGARFEAFQYRNLGQLANGVDLAVDRLVAHARPSPERKPSAATGAGALAVCERSPHHVDAEWDSITRLLGDRGYRVHQSERFGAANPLAVACQDWKNSSVAGSS